MGEYARKMVGPKVEELIEDLKKAYADEWLAFFYYKTAAEIAEGINREAVASKFNEIADEELHHAEELAERIGQLGGEVIREFDDLKAMANCKTVNLPQDPTDCKAFLEAGIEAEQCAIKVYEEILEKLKTDIKDPITFHVIRHIMQEEVEHEDDFETLLG